MRVVPIVFLENQPLRPMVELKIGQSVGWFLVDTGAGAHVMSDWFFHAAFPGRELAGGRGMAVDFGGVPIPVTVVRDVAVTWKDGKTTSMDVSVGPFSHVGEADGKAGVVSPQQLLAMGYAVELDFLQGELRWWLQAPRKGTFYSLDERTMQACAAGSPGVVIFEWAAAVEGETLWAMLDSGSPVSAVSSSAPVASRLRERSIPIEAGRGASRAPIEARAAPAQMEFGGVAWRGNMALMKLPLESCNTGALVGMNILRRCSVTLAPHWSSVFCLP